MGYRRPTDQIILEEVTVTTTGGSGTAYSKKYTGAVEMIGYDAVIGSGGFDNTSGLSITTEATGENVLVPALLQGQADDGLRKRPFAFPHKTSGTAYTGAGVTILLANDRLKITVTGAGSGTRSGTFLVEIYRRDTTREYISSDIGGPKIGGSGGFQEGGIIINP